MTKCRHDSLKTCLTPRPHISVTMTIMHDNVSTHVCVTAFYMHNTPPWHRVVSLSEWQHLSRLAKAAWKPDGMSTCQQARHKACIVTCEHYTPSYICKALRSLWQASLLRSLLRNLLWKMRWCATFDFEGVMLYDRGVQGIGAWSDPLQWEIAKLLKGAVCLPAWISWFNTSMK